MYLLSDLMPKLSYTRKGSQMVEFNKYHPLFFNNKIHLFPELIKINLHFNAPKSTKIDTLHKKMF